LVPKLDQQLDWLAKGIELLEKELSQQDEEEARGPSEDRREAIRQARVASRAQLEALREAFDIALSVKREALQRLQDRCREVARSLPSEEEAHWRQEISRVVAEGAKAHLDPALDERVKEIEARIAAEESSR
jgi:predicted  nucleic acid-binding Zn-ribbon protein